MSQETGYAFKGKYYSTCGSSNKVKCEGCNARSEWNALDRGDYWRHFCDRCFVEQCEQNPSTAHRIFQPSEDKDDRPMVTVEEVLYFFEIELPRLKASKKRART